MKLRNEEIEKLYFTIYEVGQLLDMTTSAVRYWENYFKIITHRKKNNNRKFTKKDIAKLKLIQKLVLVDKYTLEGAKIQYIKLLAEI